MRDLTAALVQCELAWENPADNRNQFQQLIETIEDKPDLIVLPEMFTTGFSMNALANAEEPGGATEQWLADIARSRDCDAPSLLKHEYKVEIYDLSCPNGEDMIVKCDWGDCALMD